MENGCGVNTRSRLLFIVISLLDCAMSEEREYLGIKR